jgi:hypothetical protein
MAGVSGPNAYPVSELNEELCRENTDTLCGKALTHGEYLS